MSDPLPPQVPHENREANRRWLNVVRESVFDGSPEAMADALGLDEDDRVVLRRVLTGAARLVPDDIMQKVCAFLDAHEDLAVDLTRRYRSTPCPGEEAETSGDADTDASAGATDGEADGEADGERAEDWMAHVPGGERPYEVPEGLSVDDAPTLDDLRDALTVSTPAGARRPSFALFDVYTLEDVCLLQLANGETAYRRKRQATPGEDDGSGDGSEASAGDDAPPLTLPLLCSHAAMLAQRGRDVSVIVDLPNAPDAPSTLRAAGGRVCLCRRNGRLSVRKVILQDDASDEEAPSSSDAASVVLECPAGRSEPVAVDPDDVQLLGTLRTLYQRL